MHSTVFAHLSGAEKIELDPIESAPGRHWLNLTQPLDSLHLSMTTGQLRELAFELSAYLQSLEDPGPGTITIEGHEVPYTSAKHLRSLS